MQSDYLLIFSLFYLIKEKFSNEMEQFHWRKHLSGYSVRIRDKLLFDMKLLYVLRIFFANPLALKLFASAYLHTLNT